MKLPNTCMHDCIMLKRYCTSKYFRPGKLYVHLAFVGIFAPSNFRTFGSSICPRMSNFVHSRHILGHQQHCAKKHVLRENENFHSIILKFVYHFHRCLECHIHTFFFRSEDCIL